MSRILSTVVLALAGLLGLTAGAAEACSCIQPGPPCQEYWRADAIFVGTVTSSERTSRVPAQFGTGRRVTFTVASGFKGTAGDTAIVNTGLGGGDCGYPFKIGESYVVYASLRADGTLTTGICSRTALLSKAAEDVAYATALADGTATEGGVAGRVRFNPRTMEQDSVRAKPMAGTTVVVTGPEGTRRLTTDPDGRFAATGLQPGRYSVRLDLPAGYYALGTGEAVELADARACADVTVHVLYDGHVSGRVLDSGGRPVAGLTLDVVSPSQLERRIGGQHRTLTGRDGRFEFTQLPPGRFVVALNPVRSAQPSAEPSVYFPGVTVPERADVQTLGGGAHVDVGTFTLPASVTYVPVEGIVLGPEGAPAEGAKVYLKLAGEQGFLISEPAVTGADGTFVLAALSGRQYEVVVDQVLQEDGTRRLLSAGGEVFTAAPGMASMTLTLRPPR